MQWLRRSPLKMERNKYETKLAMNAPPSNAQSTKDVIHRQISEQRRRCREIGQQTKRANYSVFLRNKTRIQFKRTAKTKNANRIKEYVGFEELAENCKARLIRDNDRMILV
jgi:hypothetical protein